jgi:predicted glycosyltransferase
MKPGPQDGGWVWFDFENTPQVLFLEPLVRHVHAAGWATRLTARPQSQTLALARLRGLDVTALGVGDLEGLRQKVAGGVSRVGTLLRWLIRSGRPRLLVSASRSASLAARFAGVCAVGLLDYEHAEQGALAVGCRSLWFPDILRRVRLPLWSRRIARYYAGLKENLYLDDWRLDRVAERRALGIAAGEYLVVTRPPAESAHYAAEGSSRLWLTAVRELATRGGTRLLVIARTEEQRRRLHAALGGLERVEFSELAVNGPNIVAAADLVLGGGGTMNREGAVLGVPVWSVFCGPSPAIDEQLAREGRLRWVRSEEELSAALHDPPIELLPRRGPFPQGVRDIMGEINACLDR